MRMDSWFKTQTNWRRQSENGALKKVLLMRNELRVGSNGLQEEIESYKKPKYNWVECFTTPMANEWMCNTAMKPWPIQVKGQALLGDFHIKQWHPTVVTWNPKGKDTQGFLTERRERGERGRAQGSGDQPPPPPPPAVEGETTQQASGAMSARALQQPSQSG